MPSGGHYTTSLHKTRGSDIYYTPPDLAKDIIACCDLKQGDSVLDPFYGGGVFYDNYPEYVSKDWCEIVMGRDFMEYDKKVDWIISNPPFSILKTILPKCIATATKGICLILGCHNLTPKRNEMFENAGFKLTHLEDFNVKAWFGFRCCFVVYEKNKPTIRRLKRTTYD